MGEIVNLRLARKRKAREQSAQRAEQNRNRFGETKRSRKARLAELLRIDRSLDGHKRTDSKSDNDD